MQALAGEAGRVHAAKEEGGEVYEFSRVRKGGRGQGLGWIG